ncbi:MAG: dihydroorotate dehydrogenase [Candidatus Bathyarchaeia archaeon]
MSKLSTEIAGLKLGNPTMLASGFLGVSGETLKRVVEAGAGAVVTKSSSLKPRNGNPGPTIVEVPCGLLNAIGLASPGISMMKDEVAVAKRSGVPVIVSIFGFSVSDYSKSARIAENLGADAVELNVSCPHVSGVGEIGQDSSVVGKVTRSVKRAVDVPVFVKLSPNVANIVEIGRSAERAGADAITAINTLRAMAIDIQTRLPILSAKIGGLSGPAVKPVAVRCVYELSEKLKVPIIGVGGIVGWEDAVEFILAGASSVQIGTAILHRDLRVFCEVTDGLSKYLDENGFKNISEIVGLAHSKPA